MAFDYTGGMRKRVPETRLRQALRPACFLLAFLLASCAQEPIRVGFAGSITGRQSALGLEGKEAVELAIAEANEAGGVGGRRLLLYVLDDADDPARAAANHLELERLGVVAIIGHSTSVMMQAAFDALDFYAEARVPVISGTVSSSLFSGKADAFFRVVNDSTREAVFGAEFLRGLGVEALAVAYDAANESYALTYAQLMVESFRRLGGRSAPPVAFNSTALASDADVAESLLEVVGREPRSAVALAAGGIDTGLLAQALRKRGYGGTLLSSAWGKTPDLLINGGAAVQGMYFFENYDASNRSLSYLRFAAEFERRYGRPPNFSAVNHYEAALLLLAALRAAGGGRLIDSLRGMRSIEGLQGPILLDEYGDAQRPLVLLEARGDSFVTAGAG